MQREGLRVLAQGLIIKGIGGFYYVQSENGVYACRARGVFRKKGITPFPGDSVDFSVTDSQDAEGFIESIHERKTCLVRPAVANVGRLIAVVSVTQPGPDLELLDKLLISAELQSIDPVICVNKIDLDTGNLFDDVYADYSPAGYRVIAASGLAGTGVMELNKLLADNISVFAGQSGVGKSTLLNRVLGRCVMETGELSVKKGRGKHTTRHAQLVEVEQGGYIVDTPGFSSFRLEGLKASDLCRYYPEFNRQPGGCRFRGCTHRSEPQCVVKEDVEKGLISNNRYERYMQLYSKIEDKRR